MTEFYSKELMAIYYKKLFPFDLLTSWIIYDKKIDEDKLNKREISFTLEGDIFLRYQSFKSVQNFKDEVTKVVPIKLDIGAVYTASPKLHRSLISPSYKPISRELVFDIDLTDYDDIRFCCGSQNPNSKTFVCSLCWKLAKNAVVVLDRALKEDFGFKHLLWIFSGRRGVHCWIGDREARNLDSNIRSCIVDYLSLAKAAGRKGASSSFYNHPFVEKSLALLNNRFLDYIKTKNGQNIFGRKEGLDLVIKLLPKEMSKEAEIIRGLGDKSSDSDDVSLKRWKAIRQFLESENRHDIVKEIILFFSFPRLDANVTTGMNHLLKSPFCVHPKTGQICVPFLAENVDKFSLESVPTLPRVLDELAKNTENLHPYKKTSMREGIEIFEEFVDAVTRGEEAHLLSKVTIEY